MPQHEELVSFCENLFGVKTLQLTLFSCLLFLQLRAQDRVDSIPAVELQGIEISSARNPLVLGRLPEVHGLVLIGSKKNEVIELSKTSADLASGAHRQVFARVPGLMLWENDGSGIQIGIGSRGLSPNRSWEFNNRQNGYDITPDVFGYPEAYYTPPLEALERIEVIRGAASLQFGPQFGGLVNYVIKNGKGKKPFFYEGSQSLGSYRLVDSYNAIGGSKGRWNYYGFVQQRAGDGWRENSVFTVRSAYAAAECRVTEKCTVGVNITHSEFLSQQPGGLTQEQFDSDWRQSTRSRNWLNTPWNVAAVYADIQTTAHSALNIKVFGVLANRSSVGFLKAINIADTINAETNEYNFRKLDIDHYQTLGTEARWLLHYKLGLKESHLAAGMRYSDAHTHRMADGLGSTGNEFNAEIAEGNFGKDLHFENINVAYFMENIFNVTKKLKITPGVRLEQIQSKSSGYISITSGEFAPIERRRFIPLTGLGLSYELAGSALYANFSQAYRPVTYSDLTPAGTTDIIDTNLKDASGLNADAGWRGCVRHILNVDAGVFYLQYDNRIGVVQRDGVNFKTNIGTSVSKGVEVFAESFPQKVLRGFWSAFISGAWMDARYIRWDNPQIADDPTLSIANKRVEYAPEQSCKAGFDYKHERFSLRAQWTYVGEVYTDATNTTIPSANAQVGVLPSYSLLDACLKLYLSNALHMQLSMNNILDARYATRRAGGYPGPGLLPGTGRTITLTFNLSL